jgi:hypothetical protein
MTESDFIEEVRRRVGEILPKVGLIADCSGNTSAQTIAKVEACAFIGCLAAMLDKIGKAPEYSAGKTKPPPIDQVLEIIRGSATPEESANFIRNHLGITP